MTYADPARCPGCGAPTTGAPTCHNCGIELRGPVADYLLATLTEADRTLYRLRVEAHQRRAAAVAAPRPAQASPGGAHWQQAAQNAPAARGVWQPMTPPAARSGPSVGSVLLALGALCLVVAAFVFATVAWSSLSTAGRAAMLGVVLLALGGAAAWATGRRLRATAEALWAVTFVVASLEVALADVGGVLGLDRVDGDVVALVTSALIGAAGFVVAVWSRVLGGALVVPQLIVGLAVLVAGWLGWAVVDLDHLWVGTPVAATAVLVLLGCAAAGLPVAAWATVPAALTLEAGAWLTLAGALLGSPSLSDHWRDPTGVMLLAQTVLALGLAVLGSRVLRRHPVLVLVVQTVATVLAVVTVALLVATPAGAAGAAVAAVAWVLLPIGVALLGLAVRGGWGIGVRVALVPVAAGLVAGLVELGVALLESVVRAWSPWFGAAIGLRFDTRYGLDTWIAGWMVLGLAALMLTVSTWRFRGGAARVLPGLLRTVAAALVPVAVGVVLTVADAPVLVVALFAVLAGTAVGLLGALGGAGQGEATVRLWTSAAVVMVAIGALLPLGSASGAAITWAVGAVGLGCVAASVRSLPAQALLAAVSCILVLGVVPTSLTALGASPTWVCAAAVVAGVAIVAVVQVPGTPVELRLTLEPVGWAGAGIAVVAALAYGLVPGSLALTVAGAGAVVIGLVSQDRRPAAVVGSGLLGAAYVLRLLAAGVDVVEVYTAPFAVVLLVVGGIVMARRPGSRTAVTLFPGLVLATLPSLPGALEDPLSLRGLLLALGAVVMLVVGVAVRWQAPLLLGAALVTILALRQLGPYLGDTPRWIPLSVLGAALLVVGATWEARVANARAAVAYVRRLR